MTVFNNFRNDTRVLREAKSLKSMGFDVTVVAVYSAGQKRKEEMEGIRVFRLTGTFSFETNQTSQKVAYFGALGLQFTKNHYSTNS